MILIDPRCDGLLNCVMESSTKEPTSNGSRTNSVLVSSILSNVIHVTCHSHEKSCSLKAQLYRFDQLQTKFISIRQTPSTTFQVSHLKYVVHGLVEDDVTGLVNLYVVVEAEFLTATEVRWIYYVLQVTEHSIMTISKFDLLYQLSKMKIHLANGPKVVWCCKDNLTIYDIAKQSQKSCTRHSSGWIDGGTLLWSGVIGRDLVAIGTVKELQESSDGMLSTPDILMSFQSRHHFVGIDLSNFQRNYPISKLLPDVYAEIVIAMSVNSNDSSNVIICTRESQLISLKGGQIQSVCQLPFKDAVEVDVAITAGGKELIIVHSASSDVCCVWSKSFEVAETWQGVHMVLVDDFFQCGNDQILMLVSDPTQIANIFAGFILTDLQSRNIKDGVKANMEVNVGSQSNLKSAVRALQTRMQISVAAVKESRLKLADKVRMIHQSHKALVNMVNGNAEDAASPAQTASLICLFDGSPEEGSSITETNQVQISKDNGQHPSVSSPWQCLVGDEWIVGLKVHNATSKTFHRLALLVIARDDQLYPITLQCRSSLTSLANNVKGQDEPLLKRMKYKQEIPKPQMDELLPNDTAFVCAVTKLPAFSQPNLVCNLALHWKDNLVDKSEPVKSICVGNATLMASDVAGGDLQVSYQESRGSLTNQDEMTLNAVQLETMLDITSHHSHINQIGSVIQNSLKFLKMKNTNGFICTAGAFSLCRVYITNLNAKMLKIQVFTR
ncbi:Fanconi anemia group B protein-like [Anneissia japonica]|uniref:Fanconi anemia group B protein-like n=1 Tax=Anneissia japonica TaxID=1529436 RepID=UPI00142597C3|nr:Fanconi anemia group B protein-like [Anneissia japonica]